MLTKYGPGTQMHFITSHKRARNDATHVVAVTRALPEVY
jgi:hypothetical protein